MDARVRLSALALAALCGSCSFAVDNRGSRFRCEGGDCPPGFECVDGTCLEAGGGAVDGAPGGDGAPSRQTCEEQYGDIDDFVLCSEEADRCDFFANASGGTCSQLCDQRGGACTDGHDGDELNPCDYGTRDGCDEPHDHLICTCTLTAPGG